MMKRNVLVLSLAFVSLLNFAQSSDQSIKLNNNKGEGYFSDANKLAIGGYGEVHYNQPLDGAVRQNGALDVHRVVMLFGYTFNERTQFITELEFEHVSEVYVEQAYLQYKLNRFLNFKGGLLLVPMGIINAYHEPTTFNGVERPLIDTYLVPTTWREVGFGVTGNILPVSIAYQLYVLNGFNGYDGSAHLSGKNGLRKGRQKGAESYISTPNFSGKVEFYGTRGLNIGLSGYVGKTQSTLYDGMDKNDNNTLATADSSVLGISMIGVDTRYNLKGFQLRGQFYYASLSNSKPYNLFTANSEGKLNDVGRSMLGFYAEVGYNVLRPVKTEMKLVPFVRYEFLDTHHSVDNATSKNLEYEKKVITTGLTYTLTKGAVVKADMQFAKSGNDNKSSKILNVGIGVMF